MKKIKNIERIASTYSTWKPSDVAFLKSIVWSVHNLTMVVYCQLRDNGVGWPDISDDFFEITMSFDNVSNFRLDFVAKGLQQVSGFDILDVSKNALEGINYQVEDYEDGTIGFNCESVEIIDVSAPGRIIFP